MEIVVYQHLRDVVTQGDICVWRIFPDDYWALAGHLVNGPQNSNINYWLGTQQVPTTYGEDRLVSVV
jgi:hypothetical protein